MKKLYTLFLAALMGVGAATAQTNPDRVLIWHKGNSQPQSLLAERVDSITFMQKEGRVATDIEIHSITLDSLIVSLTPTEQCFRFKLMCLPEVLANRLTDDAALANYIDQKTDVSYTEAFKNGILKDPSLEPDTKYVMVTLGFDNWNTACSVARAPFQMPKRPLVGSPKVETDIVNTTHTEFTIDFYPNEDVAGFAAVAGGKGEMQKQYEQFAPMFGFKNFGQMVEMWGFKGGNESVGNTWNRMDPGTEYEVFVQAWDSNHTYAPCDTITVKTLGYGGEGVAEINVELGTYYLGEWPSEEDPNQTVLLPTQPIKYIPNDQTARYRTNVVLDSVFNKDPEGFKKDLAMDPPMPTVGWYQYEAFENEYLINPNTKFVVLTAPRNSLGTWSEVKVERFTTPAEPQSEAKPTATPMFFKSELIKSREIKNKTIYIEAGKVPNFNFYQQKKGLTLTR